MMVPKIMPHAASVVVQNKKDRVQGLGRGTRSPPASISGSSINVLATRLKSRSRTVRSNRTQGNAAHFWKNNHRLLLGNWNVLTLTEKELNW